MRGMMSMASQYPQPMLQHPNSKQQQQETQPLPQKHVPELVHRLRMQPSPQRRRSSPVWVLPTSKQSTQSQACSSSGVFLGPVRSASYVVPGGTVLTPPLDGTRVQGYKWPGMASVVVECTSEVLSKRTASRSSSPREPGEVSSSQASRQSPLPRRADTGHVSPAAPRPASSSSCSHKPPKASYVQGGNFGVNASSAGVSNCCPSAAKLPVPKVGVGSSCCSTAASMTSARSEVVTLTERGRESTSPRQPAQGGPAAAAPVVLPPPTLSEVSGRSSDGGPARQPNRLLRAISPLALGIGRGSSLEAAVQGAVRRNQLGHILSGSADEMFDLGPGQLVLRVECEPPTRPSSPIPSASSPIVSLGPSEELEANAKEIIVGIGFDQRWSPPSAYGSSSSEREPLPRSCDADEGEDLLMGTAGTLLSWAGSVLSPEGSFKLLPTGIGASRGGLKGSSSASSAHRREASAHTDSSDDGAEDEGSISPLWVPRSEPRLRGWFEGWPTSLPCPTPLRSSSTAEAPSIAVTAAQEEHVRMLRTLVREAQEQAWMARAACFRGEDTVPRTACVATTLTPLTSSRGSSCGSSCCQGEEFVLKAVEANADDACASDAVAPGDGADAASTQGAATAPATDAAVAAKAPANAAASASAASGSSRGRRAARIVDLEGCIRSLQADLKRIAGSLELQQRSIGSVAASSESSRGAPKSRSSAAAKSSLPPNRRCHGATISSLGRARQQPSTLAATGSGGSTPRGRRRSALRYMKRGMRGTCR